MEKNEQHSLTIQYMINETPEGNELFVAAPDGTVLDFDMDENTTAQIEDILHTGGFWKSVIGSLITSIERANATNEGLDDRS